MQNRQFTALLYGWIAVLGLIFIASVILALLLRFTSFNDPTLTWVTLIVGLISLFLGGLISGVKGKARGWLLGGLTGLGFTLLTFLVQYLGYQQGFSLSQSLHHVGFVLAALLGGMVGVSVSSDAQE
ncbi:TIGR04086 family membrane protein [Lentibacillus sediminis]|uniref:TIGR04086 family membrane protein n=1 Tax=Lentibacillus sediminis TaxID=1940529 RepID=UPI000C1BCD97|nr:TIGR04086 family membrane protein [Lentibacillus sediminis]